MTYVDAASCISTCYLQDVVSELVRSALQPSDDTSVILVEGFPRTKDQLEEFHQWVSSSCITAVYSAQLTSSIIGCHSLAILLLFNTNYQIFTKNAIIIYDLILHFRDLQIM